MGRVPIEALFTAKHLTVLDLLRIALSKRRGENKMLVLLIQKPKQIYQ
jgi:hypothetical protein